MKCPESTATVRSRGQQAVEGERERARVHPPVHAAVLVRLVAPRAGGDLLAQLRPAAEALAAHARRDQRPRRLRRVADHPRVDGPVGAERLLVEVDLHHAAHPARSARRRAWSSA